MSIYVENLARIRVNGEYFYGIGHNGLFTVNTKTYAKDPQRSLTGEISNINQIRTVIIPRADFNFKYMSIEDYQRFCTATIPNEFVVEYFDKQEGTMVQHKMYLAPEQMTKLYNVGKNVIGVLDFEISLIGTLNPLNQFVITYNANGGTEGELPSFTEYAVTGSPYQPIKIRNGADYLTKSGEIFSHWNTDSGDSDSGVRFDSDAIILPKSSKTLYAIYSSGAATYTLGLNYMGGITVTGEGEEQVILPQFKTVTGGIAIGELPTPTRENFNFQGWFPIPYSGGTPWDSGTVYNIEGNSTLYAGWLADE